MKIVVIGATGLIGSKIVARLDEEGHEAVAAALESGVNTVTGDGLAQALDGAEAVIDVSNSPSFEGVAAIEFFTTSTANLLAAGVEAGIRHHVALSIVGADRLTGAGYFRAKVAQEELALDSSIPHTVVRCTQFFEFVDGIANGATDGDTVRLPHALFQPISGEEAAAAVCEISEGPPANSIVEIAGPEEFHVDELIRHALAAKGDPRTVVADPRARYFGAELHERTLLPDNASHFGKVRFDEWLAEPVTIGHAGASRPSLRMK